MNLLLRCANLAKTRAYYADVLGFEVFGSPGGTCSARMAGSTLIFMVADLWHGPPNLTGTIYFFVPDVDAYCAKVKVKPRSPGGCRTCPTGRANSPSPTAMATQWHSPKPHPSHYTPPPACGERGRG